MQAEGTLELIAELSVAFAGFTGLAGVLTRRRDEASALGAEIRLLVEYSLVTMVQAVVPLIAWNAGLSEPMAWRVACAYAALQSLIYYVLRFREVRANVPPDTSTAVFWFIVIGDWLFIAAFIAAAAAIVPFAAGLYVINLFWGLGGTALSFVRLTRPLWRSELSRATPSE